MDWRHAVSLFTADTTARTLDNGVVDFFWFSRDSSEKRKKRDCYPGLVGGWETTEKSWTSFSQLPVAGQQQTPFPSLRKQTRHGSPPPLLIRSCSPSAPNSLKAGSYKLVSWGLLRSEKKEEEKEEKKLKVPNVQHFSSSPLLPGWNRMWGMWVSRGFASWRPYGPTVSSSLPPPL